MSAPSTHVHEAHSPNRQRDVEAVFRLTPRADPYVAVAGHAAPNGRLDNPRNEATRECSLCGSTVSGGPVCRPRLRCEPCARAAYFIAAAVRAIKELDESRQRQARKALFAAANGLASRKVRGAGARFVKVAR